MLPFDELEPGLALSATPRSAADVIDAPFAAILNLCDFGPCRYERGLRSDVELVRRPINDEYPVPLPSLLLATLELADLRRRGLATLVHCRAGQSRSPSVVALYWMARDGLGWDEAVARLRARREIVEPNRFFATDRRRPAVLRPVRDFIAGNLDVLETARRGREDWVRCLRERTPDPAQRDEDWNLIEVGLAVANVVASPASLLEQGIRDVLLIGDGVEHDSELWKAKGMTVRSHRPPDDAASLAAVLQDIQSLRERSHSVCLLSAGDERAGMAAACAFLMQDRGWDVAAAMWYVGSRRSALWPQADSLWSIDWDALLPLSPTRRTA